MKRIPQFNDFGAIPDSILTEFKRVLKDAGFSIELAELIAKYPQIAEVMVQAAFNHPVADHGGGVWRGMHTQLDYYHSDSFFSSDVIHSAKMRATNVIESPGNVITLSMNRFFSGVAFYEAIAFYLRMDGMPHKENHQRVVPRDAIQDAGIPQCEEHFLVWEVQDYRTHVGKIPSEVVSSGRHELVGMGALAALCMHQRWFHELRRGRQAALWIGGLEVTGVTDKQSTLLMVPDRFSKRPGHFTFVPRGREGKTVDFLRKNNIQWIVPTVIARY